ncbi:MAG: hypothetical protein RBS89_07340 [Candidatus Delongbacteria bacterium]|jgi:tetratricopeptide (TPR) repeat protein|nr:hypothetical protein [Candidatus Delongbacteria bacterium]
MSKIVKLPDHPSWEYMFKAEKILSEDGDRAEAVRLYSKAVKEMNDSVGPGLLGLSVANKLGDLVWAREILEKWFAARTKFIFFDMPIADIFATKLNDIEKARAIYEDFSEKIVDPCWLARTAGGFARVLKDEDRAKELYFKALVRGREDRGIRGVFDVIFSSLANDLSDKYWARVFVKNWIECVAYRDDISMVLEAVDKLEFDPEERKKIYKILVRRAKRFPFKSGLDTIQEWFNKEESKNGL